MSAGEHTSEPRDLLWDITCAPNAGCWNVAERTVGGHALLAVGVGRRLMIMSKESFGVLHVTSEMPSEVVAVAWGSAGSLRRKRRKSSSANEGESSVAYGVVAAGCMLSIDLFMAEGASPRTAFPFNWLPLASLTYGPQHSPQRGFHEMSEWSGMHLTVRSQKGYVAAATPVGLYVWKILDGSSTSTETQSELPIWEAKKQETSQAVVHASFSADCQMLVWVMEKSKDIRVLVLPFPEKQESAQEKEEDEGNQDASDADGRELEQEAKREIRMLEERLPECMRSSRWRTKSDGPLEGEAVELGDREWSVHVGAPCVLTAWSKASHFTSVPEIRTLVALRRDSKIMVRTYVCVMRKCEYGNRALVCVSKRYFG
jgi:hypothetical protein